MRPACVFYLLHRALARECLPPTLALAARDTSTLSSVSTHGGVEEGWARNGQVWWLPVEGCVELGPASTKESSRNLFCFINPNPNLDRPEISRKEAVISSLRGVSTIPSEARPSRMHYRARERLLAGVPVLFRGARAVAFGLGLLHRRAQGIASIAVWVTSGNVSYPVVCKSVSFRVRFFFGDNFDGVDARGGVTFFGLSRMVDCIWCSMVYLVGCCIYSGFARVSTHAYTRDLPDYGQHNQVLIPGYIHDTLLTRYILWGYPGIYSGGTRVYTLGVPGYILWRYPGIYSGSTRVYTLGVPGYLPENYYNNQVGYLGTSEFIYLVLPYTGVLFQYCVGGVVTRAG